MRLIAFITHCADILQILNHIGVESDPPHISPARGQPLWEDGGDAQMRRCEDGRRGANRTGLGNWLGWGSATGTRL
jgi:hypothetical protein